MKKQQQQLPSMRGVVLDFLGFGTLVVVMPYAFGGVQHGLSLSVGTMLVVAFFLLFAAGAWALDSFSCSTTRLSDASRKPSEFRNTILSLINAVVLAGLFLRAMFVAVTGAAAATTARSGDYYSSSGGPVAVFNELFFNNPDEFALAILPSIAHVVALAIGYLAADLLDMWRKKVLTGFLLAHHVGASLPAAIWLYTEGSYPPLTRAILLIVSCEVNSVVLHTRRLMHLLPGASDTWFYPVVDKLFYITLFLFRVCTSLGILLVYIVSGIINPSSYTITDGVVLAGFLLFAHHNITLLLRARATAAARKRE